jgi:HK97 family phage portal protein
VKQPRTRSPMAYRAQYARTPNSFLVNDPDGFPSDFPPIWWHGLDSGGGRYPIGPNGPYTQSVGAVPAVLRATALITGPLTAAPFRVIEPGPAVGAPSPSPRWLLDPMLLRTDERFGGPVYPEVSQLGRGAFFAEWIRSAIWFGLGAFVFTEDNAGQPLAGSLRNVHPRMLSTTRVDGVLRWVLGSTEESESITFDRDGYASIGPVRYRILVLRNPHSPVDTEGMSQGVFAQSPAVFSLAGQIDTYASGTFRSGVPAGYLQVKQPGLTEPMAQDLKARWLASHGGDRRSIAVLNSTTEFMPLNLSPVDAALDSVKRLNLADVAFAFGLDPMTLGAGLQNSATYSNLRDAWGNHRDFGLALWISAVQDALSALLPGDRAVGVNLDGFANPTARERFEGYEIAVDAGILTINEARALEGLPPLDNPDPVEPDPVVDTPPEVPE